MHSLSIKLFLLYFKHWGDKLWTKIIHHVVFSGQRFRPVQGAGVVTKESQICAGSSKCDVLLDHTMSLRIVFCVV